MSSTVVCGGSVAALSLAQECQSTAASANYNPDSFRNEKPLFGSAARRRGRGPGDADVSARAEQVLRAFNTWSFKREQPSDSQLMLRTIADAIAAQAPVRFVLYWGKGPRCQAAAPEAQCLEFLAALAARVAAVHASGAAMVLILTDTHAELNGHCREEICRYFGEIEKMAEQYGFQTRWLGQLVSATGVSATNAPAQETIAEEMLARLVASAQKWYHGPGTAREGALTYLRMNLVEQRAVERAFPGSIFITFNGSELRALFPRQLPIFYMYSLRRGVSVKPWFLPCEPAAAEPGVAPANALQG
jgi:L-tyrosine isonitrile synthase